MTEDPTLTDEELAPASAAYQVRFARYDSLAPFARNAQIHDDANVAAIAASIEQFGFVGTVIADAEGILAGHGRTLAAERLYKAGKRIKAPNGALLPRDTVPWIDVTGLSDAQRRAYIIADNQLVRASGTNQEFLRLEVADLNGMDFDLNLLGFEPKALDALLAPMATEEEGSGADEPATDIEEPNIIKCPSCAHEFSVLKEEPKSKKKRKAA